jgi:hypothetical protein
MGLKKIRLVLARDHDHPGGSLEHGYELVAPLTEDDRLDHDAWPAVRARCLVHRFWAGEEDENGHLVRTRGGNWAFHYDLGEDLDNDEVGFRFGDHIFRPGEYVSVREHDGEMRTFRVTLVEPVAEV